MSRLQVLAANPRLALGALVTLLLAAGAVVGSGADFTATSANPSNVYSSGTLTIGNSNAGTAIFSPTNLRPGETPREGTVDIENTGSLSGNFSLVRGTVTNTDAGNPMAAKLNMIVVDCGTFTGSTPPTCGDIDDVTKYTGTLAAMGTTALGSYNANVKHRYRFSVALDSSADDAYQGDSATAAFDFNAT